MSGDGGVARASTSGVASYLDEYLEIGTIADYPNALNGLQLENRGEVSRIAGAVDASERAIREAARRNCDLLLVHHGLFWGGNEPVTGRRYRKLAVALEADLAVYSAHLPLDVHAEVGNNVLLSRAVGIEPRGEFGEYGGRAIGRWGELELELDELLARVETLLGVRVRLVRGGPAAARRIGVVTGGGGSLIESAVAAGLDTLITGEGAHHTYFDAEEGGINVLFGGHYATETFGVRALAEHVGARFGLPWEFLDLPTGT